MSGRDWRLGEGGMSGIGMCVIIWQGPGTGIDLICRNGKWMWEMRKKGDLKTVSYHTSDCMVEEVQVYVLHHDLLCECWLCSDRSWNVTRWWFHQVTNKTLVGPNQYDMAVFHLEGSFVFWIIYIWLSTDVTNHSLPCSLIGVYRLAKCPHWWQLNLNVK